MALPIERIKKIYIEHFKLWGIGKAVGKFHEEAGELMQALNKHLNNPTEETRIKIIGEIADVQVTIEKIEHIFGSDEVQSYKEKLLLKMESKSVREKFKRAENKRKIKESMNDERFKIWQLISDTKGIATDGDIDEIIAAVKIYTKPD